MAVDHYENFPVASVLLPPRLREPVAAIYWFARTADDFADEGDVPAPQRLASLNSYRDELDAIEQQRPTTHPIFQRLRPVIAQYHLPIGLFRDLLEAFSQDVVQTRYGDSAELMDYCRRSADPVGRLMLHLFDAATDENLRRSDAICTALQLINHWQDVGIDASKHVPRLYLPRTDLERFNVSEETVLRRIASAEFRALLKFQVDRARALMLQGAPLGRTLPGRIGLEIRSIVAGGLTILDKIEAVGYDVFSRRPVLGPLDGPRLLWRATLAYPAP